MACNVVNPSPTGLMVNQRVSSLSVREKTVVAGTGLGPVLTSEPITYWPYGQSES